MIEEIEREAAARLAAAAPKAPTGDQPDRSMFGSGNDDLTASREASAAGLPDDALESLIAEELEAGTDDMTVPVGIEDDLDDDIDIDLDEGDEIKLKD